METSLLQPLAGAIFMGLSAGFLTYAYWDKISGRDRKKRSAPREEYYDPRKAVKGDKAKLMKAISVGFFMGVMFFFYFANR
ncbi:MAG: hypothetical protein Q7I97_03270 [Thermovirgaceae bacterium]|nr:hypothetical protein [Thermovirgaceae bacterium]